MVIRPLNNEEHALKLEYLFVNKPERGYELMHADAYEKRGLDKCYKAKIYFTYNIMR